MRCELTGTPERELNPPEGDLDMPTAQDVAYSIMNEQNSDYDIFTWPSFTRHAKDELISDLIGHIASFKADKTLTMLQNRSERLALIEECLQAHLVALAKNEGYQ